MSKDEGPSAGLGAVGRSLCVCVAALGLAGLVAVRGGAGTPEPEHAREWDRWLVRASSSIPARDLPPSGPPGAAAPRAPQREEEESVQEDPASATVRAATEPDKDPLLDHGLNRKETSPPPRFVVAGLPSDNLFTADPVGDVGRREYVQAVNSARGVEVGVFDKHGDPLRPGFRLGDLWKTAGKDHVCAKGDPFDPVVVYDHLANRWVLTQITGAGETHDVCLAVSKSPDPLGSYFLYHVGPLDFFPDYLKCGLWPDGYYLTSSASHATLKAVTYWVMEREQMLRGAPAQVLLTHQKAPFALPADLDGPPPPAGAPGLFATVLGATSAGELCRLEIRSLAVDWDRWARSRLDLTDVVATTPFRYVPFSDGTRRLVPQPEGAIELESGSHFPMHRLQYRRMGNHDSLVGNIAVSAAAGAKDRLAIRWYQLRRARRGSWRLAQEGTYGPDLAYRFYGSAAMNAAGDLAVGYSISSAAVYPSTRYAVRAADDPRGTLRREASLYEGEFTKGFQPNWGDYSAMVVDPVDQSTFWYTNMTMDPVTPGLMRTWIGKIPAPECAKGAPCTQAQDVEPGEDDGTR